MTSANVNWINNYVHPCCISHWLTGWNPPTSVDQWGRLPGRSEPLQTDLAGSSAQAIRQSSTSSDRCLTRTADGLVFGSCYYGLLAPHYLDQVYSAQSITALSCRGARTKIPTKLHSSPIAPTSPNRTRPHLVWRVMENAHGGDVWDATPGSQRHYEKQTNKNTLPSTWGEADALYLSSVWRAWVRSD